MVSRATGVRSIRRRWRRKRFCRLVEYTLATRAAAKAGTPDFILELSNDTELLYGDRVSSLSGE